MRILKTLATLSADIATPLSQLTKNQLLELQTALISLGYHAGPIDGLYGHVTRNAWAEFIDDNHLHTPVNCIDIASRNVLQDKLQLLEDKQGYDFSTKNSTMAAIMAECKKQGIGLKAQIAYVLATADHETNHTFKPVTEAYWLNDPDAYLKTHHPDYYPYYGRGFVQLTWDYNYEKYGRLLGKNLLKHPELALDPEIALFVLVHGFKTGSFTGRKITDYINAQVTDFIKARRCINGKDHAADIAVIAERYMDQPYAHQAIDHGVEFATRPIHPCSASGRHSLR